MKKSEAHDGADSSVTHVIFTVPTSKTKRLTQGTKKYAVRFCVAFTVITLAAAAINNAHSTTEVATQEDED